MCQCWNDSIRHGDVQWRDGWFDVDGRGICCKKVGSCSGVADGIVSVMQEVTVVLKLYCIECTVGFGCNACVGCGDGDGDVIIISVQIIVFSEGDKVVGAGGGGQYRGRVTRCFSFNMCSYMYCPSLSGLV